MRERRWEGMKEGGMERKRERREEKGRKSCIIRIMEAGKSQDIQGEVASWVPRQLTAEY